MPVRHEIAAASRDRCAEAGDWLRRLRRCLSRCSSRSSLRASTEPHYKILLPSSLVSTSKGAAWLVSNCARRTTTTIKCSFQARSLLLQGGGLVGPSPRASREHILIVRPLRAQGTAKLPPHVSIISNRASNSCPQAVQRMQSDSTVNSSDLIPMPPQSGQRAR